LFFKAFYLLIKKCLSGASQKGILSLLENPVAGLSPQANIPARALPRFLYVALNISGLNVFGFPTTRNAF